MEIPHNDPVNNNDDSINISSPSFPSSTHQRTRIASSSQSKSTSASLISSGIAATRPPLIEEIVQAGWTFRSVRSSISSANQIESLSREIGFPLPAMFFGNNQISIQSPILKDKDNNNLELFLFFDPIEAIKSVPKTAETVPIRIAASHADFWRQKNISETIFDYDWTYSPQSYHGKCKIKTNFSESELAACFGESDGLEIDFNRLKQQDPILFFDDNILYEDELGDNGISILSVKIRVMEYGFYVLLNHFLRVDQVIFKSTATRYFHDFSTNFILREIRTCEDSFESISEKMKISGLNFKDNEAVQQLLPIKSKIVEKMVLF